jgi:hypothetical protein
MPLEFPISSQIHILKELPEEVKMEEIHLNKLKEIKEKSWSVEESREKNKDAYKPWTTELDEELTHMFCSGINIKDMSKHFGRSKSAINSRIKKLELEDLYG